MMLELILDRIEEGRVAVFTDKDCVTYEMSAYLLPDGTKEGDAFFGAVDEDGNVIELKRRENPDAGKNSLRLRRLFDKFKK